MLLGQWVLWGTAWVHVGYGEQGTDRVDREVGLAVRHHLVCVVWVNVNGGSASVVWEGAKATTQQLQLKGASELAYTHRRYPRCVRCVS